MFAPSASSSFDVHIVSKEEWGVKERNMCVYVCSKSGSINVLKTRERLTFHKHTHTHTPHIYAQSALLLSSFFMWKRRGHLKEEQQSKQTWRQALFSPARTAAERQQTPPSRRTAPETPSPRFLLGTHAGLWSSTCVCVCVCV